MTCSVHDIEVHDGSQFRPFYASKHLLALVLSTKHTITPGQCHSRSPVLRNKPYDTRYYENYVYYVPHEGDSDRIHAIRNWNEEQAGSRKRKRDIKKRDKKKWKLFGRKSK